MYLIYLYILKHESEPFLIRLVSPTKSDVQDIDDEEHGHEDTCMLLI